MLGVVLALISALTYGLGAVLVRKRLDDSNFISVSLVVTVIGNIILWPLALLFTNLRTVNLEGVLFFVIAGILGPGITRLFYYKGMELALFADLNNVLNKRNVLAVWGDTGEPDATLNWDDTVDFLDRPHFLSAPRTLELGISVGF